METRISSTDLKNNTAEIVNLIAFGKKTVILERHGKPLVKMTPITNPEIKNPQEKEDLYKKYFGAIPDFPDVKKHRHFRNREVKNQIV